MIVALENNYEVKVKTLLPEACLKAWYQGCSLKCKLIGLEFLSQMSVGFFWERGKTLNWFQAFKSFLFSQDNILIQ